MIRLTRPLIVLAVSLLAACSTLTGRKEPFTIYSPRYAAPAPAENQPRVDWQLAVDTPLASNALDTTRMLVMPTPGAFETYKGGRWSDTAPVLLRGLLIQAFQDSGRIGGVGAATSGLHADFALAIDLYDFETQYRDGRPQAVIRLNAKLTDLSVNRVRVARTFEVTSPAGGAQAGDAAAAMQDALDRLLPSMVGWALDEGQQAWSQRHAG